MKSGTECVKRDDLLRKIDVDGLRIDLKFPVDFVTEKVLRKERRSCPLLESFVNNTLGVYRY